MISLLDQVIDTALQLPSEQREMLIEIWRNRQIEARRLEIAEDARKSIAAFREGKLKAQSAEEAIADLHQVFLDGQCSPLSEGSDRPARR